MGYYKRVIERTHLQAKLARLKAHEARMNKYAAWGPPSSDVEEGGPRCFSPVDMEVHMSILASVFKTVKNAAGEVAATDAQMERDFPGITELMTATPLVGKVRRATSTLTVVCEDGQWKVGLRDRDNQVSLWRSGLSLVAALRCLEEGLQAGTVDWRRTGDPKARYRQGVDRNASGS